MQVLCPPDDEDPNGVQAWPAPAQDTARLQDSIGNSGSFIGNQLEAQVTYNVLPGNIALEFGGAYLMHGKFLDDAPNAPRNADTTYVYAAATFTF